MDEKVRGYLFRLLKQMCSDRPARLILWMKDEEFARRIHDLYKNGSELNDDQVLQVMRAVYLLRESAFMSYGERSVVSMSDMQRSIRYLERSVYESNAAV